MGFFAGDMRDGMLPVDVKGTFHLGSILEVSGPSMYSRQFKVKQIKNSQGQNVEVAHSGSGIFWIEGPEEKIDYAIISLIK